MTRSALALAGFALLALAACDKPKPRHLPPDPMEAAPPPPAQALAATQAPMSTGLSKHSQLASFSLDAIGQAVDPLNRQPAVVSAGEPIVLRGFGVDAVARLPAKGVDLVIDDVAYGSTYGAPRADVATYFKSADLTATGFKTVLPAGLIAVGEHHAVVRVIAANGKGYFDGPPIAFTVQYSEPKRH